MHRQRWNVSGNWQPSREQVLKHLGGHANHAGKWDLSWLQSLSQAELLSLHDDDHEGRVRWEYVRRPPPAATRQTVQHAPVRQGILVNKACPGSVCPTKKSRGILRLL